MRSIAAARSNGERVAHAGEGLGGGGHGALGVASRVPRAMAAMTSPVAGLIASKGVVARGVVQAPPM